MAETLFQSLSVEERRHALRAAQAEGPYPAFLIEKDVWVVATLGVLFDAPFGNQLVFKGGTSLSKVWHVIRRFSEDVDITYDIREFAPDLVSDAGDEALPPTRSQEKRWTRTIRPRLAQWVREQVGPLIEEELARAGFEARVKAQAERLHIEYDPLFETFGTIRPKVKVDFGARSTGEPHAAQVVVCDAASHLPDIGFPVAHPAVMLAERTFWEKATAVHVYCLQGRRRGERWSRHWTTSLSSTTPGSGHALWRTANSGWRLRATRRCSFARTIPTVSGSTMRPRSRAASGSFPPAPHKRCSPMTTPACSPAGCCWTKMSRSAHSWSDAPSSKRGSTLG